jgi:hypothetical protein
VRPRASAPPDAPQALRISLTLLATLLLTACAQENPLGQPQALTAEAPTRDAATRTNPVVAGRPSRVFVYAALGPKCEPLAPPAVRIVTPPTRGEITLRPGQQTTIAASTGGNCVARPAVGTGIYYTARGNYAGLDRFTVEAKATDGTTQEQTFEVRIEP